MRPSGRAPDQMRAIDHRARLHPSRRRVVLVSFGDTRVLVTASVEDRCRRSCAARARAG